MQLKSEIQARLWHLYNERLRLRFKKYLARYYRNCQFNVKAGKDEICVCTNVANSSLDRIFICGMEQCSACQLYKCKYTKDKIEEYFLKDISNPTICGQKEPKIAVLMWVLQGEDSLNGKIVKSKQPWYRRFCPWSSAKQ